MLNSASITPMPLERPSRGPLEVLRRRWLLFCATVAAFLALVTVVVLLTPKTYTTHVKFIAGSAADPSASQETGLPVLNAILAASAQQSAETYAEILRGTPAVSRVIADLKLPLTPQELLAHVRVIPVANTSILDVAVKWKSPEGSAQIANEIANAFVIYRRGMIADQAGAAVDVLSADLPAAAARMHKSSEAVAAFEAKNGLADADAQTQAIVASLAENERKIAAAQVDEQQAAAELAVVQRQLAGATQMISSQSQVAPNPTAAQLQTQLAQVDVQLRSALRTYTEAHPTVRALQAQEEQLRREIAITPPTVVAAHTMEVNPLRTALTQSAASLATQVASDQAQLAALRAQRTAELPLVRHLPQQAARLAQLKQTAKQDLDVYNALESRLSEARIARTVTLGDVSIVAPASAADATATPNLIVDLMAGSLLAVALGVGMVFVAERLDGTIKTEDDVAELGLPVLSSIPRLSPSGGGPAWLQAASVDAFLQLVTALRYASSERLVRIAFTSAGSQDGKSAVALSTAIALAELSPRVLLIDADLRLPSLHEKVRASREPGLSDVLVGKATLDEAIRPTRHAGLDIITAGTPVPNPFALLQSRAFQTLLTAIAGRYESVILDTPACGSVVDAAVVCRSADGTVFVVASDGTERAAAERGLQRLRSAGVRNMVGAVLNRTPASRTTIGPYGKAVGEGRRALPLPPVRNGAIR